MDGMQEQVISLEGHWLLPQVSTALRPLSCPGCTQQPASQEAACLRLSCHQQNIATFIGDLVASERASAASHSDLAGCPMLADRIALIAGQCSGAPSEGRTRFSISWNQSDSLWGS